MNNIQGILRRTAIIFLVLLIFAGMNADGIAKRMCYSFAECEDCIGCEFISPVSNPNDNPNPGDNPGTNPNPGDNPGTNPNPGDNPGTNPNQDQVSGPGETASDDAARLAALKEQYIQSQDPTLLDAIMDLCQKTGDSEGLAFYTNERDKSTLEGLKQQYSENQDPKTLENIIDLCRKTGDTEGQEYYTEELRSLNSRLLDSLIDQYEPTREGSPNEDLLKQIIEVSGKVERTDLQQFYSNELKRITDERTEGTSEYYKKQARIAITEGNLDLARSELQNAIAADPSDDDATRALAQLEMTGGNPAVALEILREYLSTGTH